MLKLLQLETKDLRTEAPSPQAEAQMRGRPKRKAGCLGQNVSLRFNINCGNYTFLSVQTTATSPWSSPSLSIILLET